MPDISSALRPTGLCDFLFGGHWGHRRKAMLEDIAILTVALPGLLLVLTPNLIIVTAP